MLRILSAAIIILHITYPVLSQSIKSGDPELDSIRIAVTEYPSDSSNFELRALKMKLWAASLQQQGISLKEYVPIDDRMASVVWWNTIDHNNGKKQEYSVGQIEFLCHTIDEGYKILERKQAEIHNSHTDRSFTSQIEPLAFKKQKDIPWTHYKGNENISGYSDSKGAQKGELAWKFAVGLASEASPVISGNHIYVSSPGMRNTMFCLDLETGHEIWRSVQKAEIMGDQLYNTPGNQSTPVLLDSTVLYRELGARGNKGPARHVCILDRKSGKFIRKIDTYHVDYRAGHAPFDADGKHIVYTFGTQDIHETPPVCQGFNSFGVYDMKTGDSKGSVIIGETFSEPLIDGDTVYIGTQAGYMYAYSISGKLWKTRPATWEFKSGGPINRKACISGDRLLFGSNDGYIYCLDKYTGKLLWKFYTGKDEKKAFRFFSKIVVENDMVIAGNADSKIVVLDLAEGKLLYEDYVSDWIRSAPAVCGKRIFAATVDGRLYSWEYAKGRFVKKGSVEISRHPVYADLKCAEGKVLINDSDLHLWCVDSVMNVIWDKDVICAFTSREDRILSDQIAGGAYYQSKPVAADGLLYIGTPSRFVFALDAESGAEVWKYELGAAVSAAPVYGNGHIYVGQQGGEEDFYCLDAKSGELIWKQKTGWVWGSANYSDSMIYVPCIDGYVMALDARNGNIIWKHRFGMSVCSEPLVYEDKVIFASWDGFMVCFDKKTGDVLWQRQGAGLDSGVAIAADGKVFFKNKCIDIRNGKLLWEYKDGNSIFNITPAYHDGKVLLSCWHGLGLGGVCIDAVLYCVDAETGERLWTHSGAGLSSPVIDKDGYVYFPSIADPYFYCIDIDDSSEKWIYRMGNKVEESTPAIYRGRVYILSSDGYLHAIK